MMMLDEYAVVSRLRDVAPVFKMLFALPPVAMVLWSDSIPFSALVFLLMGAVLVFKGGVRPVDFLGWLAVPGGFLLIGTAAVAVDLSGSRGLFMVAVPVWDAYVGVTARGLLAGAHLFFRVLASLSCLYFIAFTTPVADIVRALSVLGIPLLVIEIALLVYRFVFQFFDVAGAIGRAQKSRLGYTGPGAVFRSLSALAANLFVFSLQRAEETYVAMECRGYDGVLRVVTPLPAAGRPSWLLLALLQLLLLAGAVAMHQGGSC